MTTSEIFGQEGSDASSGNKREQRRAARDSGWRPTCPECDGRVVASGCEANCADCGLVVHVDALEREPSLKAHAPDTKDRSGEWSLEPTQELRVDKGLHTTFFLKTDGKGNSLSAEKKEKMGRLKRRHKQFTMADRRDQRLNEGFRDIGMLGANLELPEFVTTQASRYLEAAKRERLPGGRMAWESLAAGAVLLAGRKTDVERTPEQVATHAKTTEERVCAAGRKIRTQTGVDVPPVRDRAVDRVVAELDDAGVALDTGVELLRTAEELMQVADAEPVGPGTPRMTVAGAAVYSADRLRDGEAVTQMDVVGAVEMVVPTSKSKIARYSQELRELVDEQRPVADAVELAAAD